MIKKRIGSFDFWQRFGKTLIVVIAVMPAAGLMVSIGKLLGTNGIIGVGRVVEDMGWAIIGNLSILFAAAIGGSWAKEKAGGAFAGIISFILINRITGSILGVTNGMLSEPTATVKLFGGSEVLVKIYFSTWSTSIKYGGFCRYNIWIFRSSTF